MKNYLYYLLVLGAPLVAMEAPEIRPGLPLIPSESKVFTSGNDIVSIVFDSGDDTVSILGEKRCLFDVIWEANQSEEFNLYKETPVYRFVRNEFISAANIGKLAISDLKEFSQDRFIFLHYPDSGSIDSDVLILTGSNDFVGKLRAVVAFEAFKKQQAEATLHSLAVSDN